MEDSIPQAEEVLKDNSLEPFVPDYDEEIEREKQPNEISKKAIDSYPHYLDTQQAVYVWSNEECTGTLSEENTTGSF